VLLGSVVAFIGAFWAHQAISLVKKFNVSALQMTSAVQVQFCVFLLGLLAVLVGGATAGASSRAGLRHGLFAGIIGGFGLALAPALLRRPPIPSSEFWLDQMHIPSNVVGFVPELAAAQFASAALVAAVGGWLGAELFPRVAAQKREKVPY
jgi:hypothetical protein